MYYYQDFNVLLGKVFTNIEVSEWNGSDAIIFKSEREKFVLYHEQDCCEYVSLESVTGDLKDLVGNPILEADAVTESNNKGFDSTTWTFYKLATIKGNVSIRWFGSSNGYYSESVNLIQVE